MSPRQTAASNLHKRSFASLGCMGDYDKAKFARLDRVCDECYQMFREPDVHTMCRWVNYNKTWRLKLEPDLIFVSNTSLTTTDEHSCLSSSHLCASFPWFNLYHAIDMTLLIIFLRWSHDHDVCQLNFLFILFHDFSLIYLLFFSLFLNRQECFTNDVFTRCVDALLLMNEHPKLQAYISDLSVGKR